MKVVFHIAKFLTAGLLILSGIVKLNDPSGFSIKLNEYFDVFSQDVSARQDSIRVVVSMGKVHCVDSKTVLYNFDTKKEFGWEIVATPATATHVGSIGIKTTWGGSSLAEGSIDIVAGDTLDKGITIRLLGPDSLVLASADKTLSFDSIGAAITVQSAVNVDVANYAKSNGWAYHFFKGCKKYTLYLSVFVCALEVFLGLALFIGWNIRLTLFITSALIIFFTFLTFYSAFFNKVTDCGCFGDFVKLKPWHSFYKDLVLLSLLSVLIIGIQYNSQWFSRRFGNKLMAVLGILTLLFGVYCYLYLPVWDFLPYKKGNDIKQIMTTLPKGERESDSIEVSFVLYKGKDSIACTSKEYESAIDNGFQYDVNKSLRRKIVVEGYKWPIHDFSINDPIRGIELKDSFLNNTAFKWVYIATFLSETDERISQKMASLFTWGKSKGIVMYALTAESPEASKAVVSKLKLPFVFYPADQKMLMTMARYNPTLYLFKGPVVIEKWSGIQLPSVREVEKLIQ